MTNAQIFISYSRADVNCVSAINETLRNHNFKTWFDKCDALPGYEFNKRIPQAITESQLFLIFLSRRREDQGFFNLELDLIETAQKMIHATALKPRVIVILLEKVTDIDYWLKDFTRVEYFNDPEHALKQLLKSLTVWALHYMPLPPDIAILAADKVSQEPQSKKLLANWLVSTVISHMDVDSIFLGCGTTIYSLWFYYLRYHCLEFGKTSLIYTMNDFIIYYENGLRQNGIPFIDVNRVGDIHDIHYAAFKFADPAIEFPAFDAAIISVAGFEISASSIGLNVCWESLVSTLKAVFAKTTREIVIIAAGRKLLEPEGSRFLDVLQWTRQSMVDTKKTLIVAIDDDIDQCKRERFQKSVHLVSSHLGSCQTAPGIIYWKKEI